MNGERLQARDLPAFTPGERGGPRYVLVTPPKRQRCDTCGELLLRGAPSVIDRVRQFGKPPRRWCAACWDRAPLPQVMRCWAARRSTSMTPDPHEGADA